MIGMRPIIFATVAIRGRRKSSANGETSLNRG
jgi:hypothetical protein